MLGAVLIIPKGSSFNILNFSTGNCVMGISKGQGGIMGEGTQGRKLYIFLGLSYLKSYAHIFILDTKFVLLMTKLSHQIHCKLKFLMREIHRLAQE